MAGLQGRPDRECSRPCISTRFTVPQRYMSQDSEFIQSIIASLLDVSGEQSKLDAVYTELIEGTKGRLKVVKHTAKKGQPWFTKELLGLRKAMHWYESSWLRSEGEDCRMRRSQYLQARQSYSRAVKRAKRQFQFPKRLKLESQLGCPKTFWQSIKQLSISRTKKKCNLLEVQDENGNVYSNEEAVNRWRDHFCMLLGGTAGGVEERGLPTGETGPKEQKKNFSEKLCLPLSSEEIR